MVPCEGAVKKASLNGYTIRILSTELLYMSSKLTLGMKRLKKMSIKKILSNTINSCGAVYFLLYTEQNS